MRGKLVSACTFLMLCCGCLATREIAQPTPRSPYVLVLGVAQDGGRPQLGPQTSAAPDWSNRSVRRFVASLLIVDPVTHQRWLVDATPDIREQLQEAAGHPPQRVSPLPVDGVLLTHAHIGHYTGLFHFGREALGAQGLPVHCSPSMAQFLSANGPWSLLVKLGNIALKPWAPDTPLALTDSLSVTAFSVPHRAEFTDTYGFMIQGPNRNLLYIPDIDKWERWDRRVEELIAKSDVALLDGTFFDSEELPGRDMSEIPHPFIVESLQRFATLAPKERGKVQFIHLNHSNPAHDPKSTATRTIEAAGARVAFEGEIFPL